jgi:hypothetical protein
MVSKSLKKNKLPPSSGQGWEYDSQTKNRKAKQSHSNQQDTQSAAGRTVAGSEIRMSELFEAIRLAMSHAAYYTVKVIEAVYKYFVRPVLLATAASIEATLRLPQTITTAIEEAKESRKLDAELDAALIDHGFLDRAMLGLTQEDEQKIADFMKEAK